MLMKPLVTSMALDFFFKILISDHKKLEKMNKMYKFHQLNGLKSLIEEIGCKAQWVNCRSVAKNVSRIKSKNRANQYRNKVLRKKGWKLHKPEDAFEARINDLRKKYFEEKFV